MADVVQLVRKPVEAVPPRGVVKGAREEWRRLSGILRERGALPPEREALLIAYVNAMALIAECDAELDKRGTRLTITGPNGVPRVHPMIGARNKASQNALQFAKRLGIIGSGTPAKPTGGDEHDAYSDLGI